VVEFKQNRHNFTLINRIIILCFSIFDKVDLNS
jgi:hypothetical protein